MRLHTLFLVCLLNKHIFCETSKKSVDEYLVAKYQFELFENFNGCNYYSYDLATKECFMFDTCPTLDDTFCPQCVSGSPGCAIEDDEGNMAR